MNYQLFSFDFGYSVTVIIIVQFLKRGQQRKFNPGLDKMFFLSLKIFVHVNQKYEQEILLPVHVDDGLPRQCSSVKQQILLNQIVQNRHFNTSFPKASLQGTYRMFSKGLLITIFSKVRGK